MLASEGHQPARRLEVVRGGWGLALAVRPGDVVRLFGDGGRVDARARNVARILGARHLTQAVLSGGHPSQTVLAVGVWVDVVHAMTALALAASDAGRRRIALADAAIAAGWAALGRRDLGRGSGPVVGHGWQDRVASHVLPWLPGHPKVGRSR